MIQLTSHQVPGDPAPQLSIHVTDEMGPGGAYHKYEITGFDTSLNPSKMGDNGYTHEFSRLVVLFQNGPLREVGANGITQEALLAILIDRLSSFQTGPFACPENAAALYHCERALWKLQERTQKRLQRGVEGTNRL